VSSLFSTTVHSTGLAFSYDTSQMADPVLLLAQTRAHAQAAKDELNGAILHDNELKIGWGKTVPIPLAPLYVAPNFAGTAAAVAQRGQLLSNAARARAALELVALQRPHGRHVTSRPRSKFHRCKGVQLLCCIGQPLYINVQPTTDIARK